MCVFDDRVRDFTPLQIEALELLADQVMEVLEARRQAARLLEAEQRFRVAFDRTPIGMMIVDLDLRLADVNDAFADIVERPVPVLIGMPLAEPVHPHDLDMARARISTMTDGETSSFREEHRFVRSDGTPVWTEVWCSVVRDADGRPLHLVKQVEDISRRREELAEVAHQAAHDHLTGLPNRLLLEDRLYQALERLHRGGEVVVLTVDLDGFKQVNDTHGHDAGDHVLIEIAERLRRSVRAGDTVCRWGGDEFVIVCEDFAGSGVARDIAQRIVLMAAQPIDIDSQSVRIGASIGAVATTDPGRSPERLLADADENLYLAKQKGRGRGQFSSSDPRSVLDPAAP